MDRKEVDPWEQNTKTKTTAATTKTCFPKEPHEGWEIGAQAVQPGHRP